MESKTKEYDIVIVGGGPAGATLARYLKKQYKVLIVDRRNLLDYDCFVSEKSCGGLLAPAAQKMLAKQGLGIPRELLLGPQMFSVKTIDYDNHLVRHYQRHYININRERFDRWLISKVPKSVDVLTGVSYRYYKTHGSKIIVSLRNKQGEFEIITKQLVGADGAISRVREQLFPQSFENSSYISIQKSYTTEGVIPFYLSVFDREVTDFYSWGIQKDNQILIGTAIPPGLDANQRFELLVNKLKGKGYIIKECTKQTGTRIIRPQGIKKILTMGVGQQNIALIGEAAGFISPSSSEGISYALKSGEMLAKSMNCGLDVCQKHYHRKVLKIKLNLVYKYFKSLIMYQPLLRSLVMKTRIFAMEVTSEPHKRK
jgi:flavin-dependent dehydrogenase